MIRQITSIFTLTAQQENHIAPIPNAEKADEWDRGTNMMKSIRDSVTDQLDLIQGEKCCYCGLQLWETGRGEIDHIAPKASRQRAFPEFTFVKQNLALACEYCNGSSKKGERDTVFRYDVDYLNCEFKIVHPYFDNPNHHYEWINERTKIVIRPRTLKGRYSFILFKLKEQAGARAKQRTWDKKMQRIQTAKNVYDRFKRIIFFVK